MLEILLSIDRELFFLINRLPNNIFTDNLFLFFSLTGAYGIIWIVLASLLVIFDGLDNRREITAIILSVLIDLIAVEAILKNLFARIRPDQMLDSYSFPSSHATIAFAAAYILTRQRKYLSWFIYLLAFLVALSRVYLGRHYPSDIIIGGILGYLIGVISFNISKKIKFKNI